MPFLDKLIIPYHDFEEREDSALSGWMIFFILTILMFAILGVYEVIYRPFISSWVKFFEISLYILPLYSCVGIAFRFRDAIFCTITSLIIFGAIFAITILRLSLLKAPFSVLALPLATFALDIVSLTYFLFSKKVKQRFPKRERRAFWFDIFPMVITAIVAVVVMGNSLDHMLKLRNYTYTQLKQFDEPLIKGINLGDYDDSFIITSVEPSDDKFIFNFLINPAGVYPYSPGVIYNDVDHDYFTRLELKKIFIENNPSIVETLLKTGINLELNFFLNGNSDMATIFISNDEIHKVVQAMNDAKELENERMKYISSFADSLSALCPIPAGHGLTLAKVIATEVKLNFEFTFNDRESNFTEIEPVFEDYVRSLFPTDDRYDNSAAPSFVPSRKILDYLKLQEMDLVYTLKAENSHFSKDFTEWRLYGLKSAEEKKGLDPSENVQTQPNDDMPQSKAKK